MLRIRHVSSESPVTSHLPSEGETLPKAYKKVTKNQHARVLRSNDLISTGPSIVFILITYILSAVKAYDCDSRKEEASCRGPCVNKSNDVN